MEYKCSAEQVKEQMMNQISFSIRLSWLVSVIIVWCCFAVNGEAPQHQFCSLKGDDCTFEAPTKPVILAKEGKGNILINY